MRMLPLATGLVALALGLVACGHGSEAGVGVAGAPASAAASGPAQASDLPLAVPAGTSSGTRSGGVGTTGSLSATPTATEPDLDAPVAAAGVVMRVRCIGTGSPTVVVVTDLGTASGAWADAAKQLSTTTRVCTYDRPGLGPSPPRHSPQQVVDAGLNARELAALLAGAGQRGPYVVVGQGYGTLVARSFARLYRGLTASVALAGLPPDHPAGQVFWTEAGHRVDIAASLRAAGPATQALAAHVLVLDDPDPGSVVAALPALVQQVRG